MEPPPPPLRAICQVMRHVRTPKEVLLRTVEDPPEGGAVAASDLEEAPKGLMTATTESDASTNGELDTKAAKPQEGVSILIGTAPEDGEGADSPKQGPFLLPGGSMFSARNGTHDIH